jgi:hypothetical protein
MISIAVTKVSGGVLDDEGSFVTGCPVLSIEAMGAAVVLPMVLVIVLFVMPAAQT